MKSLTVKNRSIFKWHGGKNRLARRFIDLFPDRPVYIEPYAGGLSVLLNKPVSRVEIAADIDPDLIEVWKAVQRDGDAIMGDLANIPYERLSFDAYAKRLTHSYDRTIAYIVRNRMSRGGLGKDFAWSDRLRGGQPGDVNAWETFVNEELPRVIERIQGVNFVCLPALHAIQLNTYPWEEMLIYADPPYLPKTRTSPDIYKHEMTIEDHKHMIMQLRLFTKKGAKVFLSGYDSPEYREWIPDFWTVHRFNMPNNAGQGKVKQRRIECLWESP